MPMNPLETKVNFPKKRYKLTTAHFDFFCEEFLFWISVLGIENWEIFFIFDDDPENRASIDTNITGRQVNVYLNKVWDGVEPTPTALSLVALHEASELLTTPLRVCAKSRYITESEIIEANHIIVQALVRVLGNKYEGHGTCLEQQKKKTKKRRRA